VAQAQITQHQHLPENRDFITLTEFLSLSDEQPFEIVSGEIILMSPVQREHNILSRRLFRSLDRFVEEHHLGEVWEEAAYVLDGNKRDNWVGDVRQPDVSFITRERVEAHNAERGAKEGPWWLAPDLAGRSGGAGDTGLQAGEPRGPHSPANLCSRAGRCLSPRSLGMRNSNEQ
jgi:Uma2 family endonuclease